ncbi:adenosylcobinamide-GDP ribazoletransferase, partial [Corynebacterium sphenisci]|uniref:adenosylcobinamide-GDP ribazoletransferase n=1 Tax=Corynebacterium sphenisci TaxID=191493 RepID=UPI0026E01F22
MSGKAGPRPPGGSPTAAAGGHGPALVEGLGTALNWLTVLPVPGARAFDRVTGRRAIAALPVVGLVVGLVQAAVLLAVAGPAGPGAAGPARAGLLAALAGLLAVAAAEALTRGMHLDGLADVADALGSFAPPARAREILADPAAGPMALGAVALTLPLHAAGLAALAAQQPAAGGAGALAAAAAPLA